MGDTSLVELAEYCSTIGLPVQQIGITVWNYRTFLQTSCRSSIGMCRNMFVTHSPTYSVVSIIVQNQRKQGTR